MIRRATLADAEGIFRVHTSAIRDVASTHYTSQHIEAWAGRLSPASYGDPIENKIVFVATETGQICGFSQLDPRNSVVEAVYVLPSHLRRGLGSRLLSAVESAAKASGLTQLTLDASLNSVSFYERAGYKRVRSVDHELNPGVLIPCMVMRKELVSRVARTKMYALAILAAVSFLGPIVELLVTGRIEPFGNFAMAEVFVSLAPIYWWYHEDKRETQYRAGPLMNGGVIAFAIAALPIYFVRSRGWNRGSLYSLWFVVAVGVTFVLEWLGEEIGTAIFG
jgi:GNAT superfamily N-acetyltransferase